MAIIKKQLSKKVFKKKKKDSHCAVKTEKSPEYAHSQIIVSNVNLFKKFTQGHRSCV